MMLKNTAIRLYHKNSRLTLQLHDWHWIASWVRPTHTMFEMCSKCKELINDGGTFKCIPFQIGIICCQKNVTSATIPPNQTLPLIVNTHTKLPASPCGMSKNQFIYRQQNKSSLVDIQTTGKQRRRITIKLSWTSRFLSEIWSTD
jgi:hypothetical protein